MATTTTNKDRIGRMLDLLKDELGPYVEREFTNAHRKRAAETARAYFRTDTRYRPDGPIQEWDVAALLNVMIWSWKDIFRQSLGRNERNWTGELLEARNGWAHQERFSSEDTERALDTAARLLTAISATESADEITKMRLQLRRTVIDQQTRDQKKRAGGTLITSEAADGPLKPWRVVVTPHEDVRTGRFQQAEFAADLWQVHLGEGSDEYRDPVEFFRRTYLTESLQKLLVDGIGRLSSGAGDPVVRLQTNFGGGKTHSMLALYHLFSGREPSELPNVESLFTGVDTLADMPAWPQVRRVVLVGNKISPGNPVTKPDGTVVRTLWGELAWQLGGAEAYARIAADDERASNPGDRLRELFNDYGPCLILIDEWVAYARQLHEKADLPGGDFETHFTFAQALTEAARSSERCLLLISLPASDGSNAPHARADDTEVGGLRGRAALERLRNVIGRVESSWRPATAEESFEIVRNRLFEPLAGDAYRSRNLTARMFSELYRGKLQDQFPPECREKDYEDRLQKAYPIHPELFDRLYEDWSTLLNFQRTRGVLRLMATVIHSLWENGDPMPLILPSTIPIDEQRVQSELTRYLSDNWTPIIDSDVDGANSLPLKLDNEVPNLGKLHAVRRVARTMYLGSAPTSDTSRRGIEDRRVKLGCVIPGETPKVFGDAIRRLAADATYLYSDGSRYWYSTQPTVTKLADDRAAQYERDPDAVHAELLARLKRALGLKPKQAELRGDFYAVYLMPQHGADVPDQHEARLVVLDSDYPYARGEQNPAELAAQKILDSRGSGPRMNKNTLAFLAADQTRLQDLRDAIRRYLAWSSIVDEQVELNLDPQQAKQAATQLDTANSTVDARLPETFCRVLAPMQSGPREPEIRWRTWQVKSDHPLAVRVSKRLSPDEHLVVKLGATIVRKALDDALWGNDDHVSVRTLVDYYAQYLYLPRLQKPEVLIEALRAGVGNLTWEINTFAYAESYDETADRYAGLQAGTHLTLSVDHPGLIVKADVARRQFDQERATEVDQSPLSPAECKSPPAVSEPAATAPRRYHGSVKLDAGRVKHEASQIDEAVIAYLSDVPDADVTVTIEIEASLPEGANEQLVRTVTENGRTLKFDNGSGFEQGYS